MKRKGKTKEAEQNKSQKQGQKAGTSTSSTSSIKTEEPEELINDEGEPSEEEVVVVGKEERKAEEQRSEPFILDQQMIQELNDLGSNADIYNLKVKSSSFYQKLVQNQDVEKLQISPNQKLTSLILLAQIASKSPKLHTIDINGYWGSEDNPDKDPECLQVSKILATSSALRTIGISHNYLGHHGEKVAEALATSCTLENINISHNNLLEDSPKIIKILLELPTLKTLNMSRNMTIIGDYEFRDTVEDYTNNYPPRDYEGEKQLKSIVLEHNKKVKLIGSIIAQFLVLDLVKIIQGYYGATEVNLILEKAKSDEDSSISSGNNTLTVASEISPASIPISSSSSLDSFSSSSYSSSSSSSSSPSISSSSSSPFSASGDSSLSGASQSKQYKFGAMGGENDKGTDINWINSSFGRYTLEGLNNILHLRLDSLQIKDVEIVPAFFNHVDNNISEVLFKVYASTEKITLVPLNLNRHAVGLIIEKSASSGLIITYIDPLNKPVNEELQQIIFKEFGFDVSLGRIIVEKQKYSNCGPEVIENFIFYLTGQRVSQEEAVKLHSTLIESKLITSDTASEVIDYTLYNGSCEIDVLGD